MGYACVRFLFTWPPEIALTNYLGVKWRRVSVSRFEKQPKPNKLFDFDRNCANGSPSIYFPLKYAPVIFFLFKSNGQHTSGNT